jgi:cytochrome c-type biogenesis protein CcmF
VGEPYFSRMTEPIGLALLFLMAIAPALPWRATSGDVLRRRLLVPAAVGVAVMVVTVVFWTRSLTTVVAFGLAAFAVAGIGRETFVAVRARRRADRTGRWRSFADTVRDNPRRYGGFVVHLGIVCIAIALAAAGAFGAKREVRLERGDSVVVDGYRVTFTGTRTERTDQKTTVAADLAVRRDGRDLGTYAPAVSTFPNSNTAIGTPSVRTGLLEDLYLTIVSSPNERGRITVSIAVHSMTVWLWIGGGLIALGTVVAIGPRVRRRSRPAVPADVPDRGVRSDAAPVDEVGAEVRV